MLSLIVIVVALVGLNAASYVRIEKEPDREENPNRSTYNAGATGTRAFYDFLRETGKRAIRWQEKTSALLEQSGSKPATFVIIGKLRRPFEEEEIKNIIAWVERGGRLVVIDREPNPLLLPPAGTWLVESEENKSLFQLNADPENVNEMTGGVSAAKPVQPTVLTKSIQSVMPSKFANSIKLENVDAANNTSKGTVSVIKATPTPFTIIRGPEQPPPPTPVPTAPQNGIGSSKPPPPLTDADEDYAEAGVFLAPVVHLRGADKNLLVDYPYGAGRVIFLSDPYIVSNGGIGLVDNLNLAVNLVDAGGVIAFDEYHQGYGARGNPLLNYFENTPIPAIAAQIALMIVLFIWTKGRRFGRPLPLPAPDRRSKLEYVAAMAELQRRARSYDLAIENIYTRTRRSLARFAGVDNLTTSRTELAARVAERSKLDGAELENLMRECEDAIQGGKINDKKALSLAGKLREIEQKLGLTNRISRKL
ncbi:MAG TPA: DUF4350 domain-containing protein [Pyrinomonadaceae bacterium]|nr:DUF4350 domain-containing protein [Pyrinomonadaceae bacterium]